jgi:hypothetical protein
MRAAYGSQKMLCVLRPHRQGARALLGCAGSRDRPLASVARELHSQPPLLVWKSDAAKLLSISIDW